MTITCALSAHQNQPLKSSTKVLFTSWLVSIPKIKLSRCSCSSDCHGLTNSLRNCFLLLPNPGCNLTHYNDNSTPLQCKSIEIIIMLFRSITGTAQIRSSPFLLPCCSDPTCGGRNYILKWVFFFCSVNFGRSIYSS